MMSDLFSMRDPYPSTEYRGILCIGDPHLQGRIPGFRKDNYPRVVLDKFRWCLAYAKQHKLLPAILGDMFNVPRDNPNWLIVELLQLFTRPIVGIYGNHDVHENALTEHDSLSILLQAESFRLLDHENLFCGEMNGMPVAIGGTPWGRAFPRHPEIPASHDKTKKPLVIWLAHHDMILPGYEEQGKIEPGEGPQVDLVINGHIHRRLADATAGGTTWITPGNISRQKRSDATRDHVPSALRIDIDASGWKHSYVEVPHRPFEEVFHETITEAELDRSESAFVAGLRELQSRRTEGGAGLQLFLEKNLDQFDEDVAAEIQQLAQEVTS
jgi:DNA repair exonuclease SbcCD nuclease subunit